MAGYGSTHNKMFDRTRTGSNGMAVAALTCGIVGVFLFNIILGPLAVIFGAVGLRRSRAGARNAGMAKAGIILGIVDIALFVLLLILAANNGGSFYFNYG
ncbi:DUF4190 domain-containing protein [Streptomyces sp. SID3343]|uniref:DUF4190 domain-containing protein n=1 Tax=Streptomyces sp. SID3343 TaxID=2690260 RepID=UPI0013701E6C|nr:DUF4190 domain-containing protein [Streptomyces sp. SID3343]MYV98768.1 DUF4190 domain-containing protein [Streptomyces sp. SID3343]